MRFNFSFNIDREGDQKAKLRKDTLEAARKALLAAHGFTCIHDDKGAGRCDYCPCSAIGGDRPHEFTYEQSKQICPLYRSYSK